MPDDAELLSCYADSRSEEAFAKLVERNLSLVYFAALRRTNGDAHLAQDVAQQVFASLARDARSVARHAVLAGWLYVATRNAAANLLRTERRRKAREQQVVTMQDSPLENGSAADWDRLRIELDAVMDRLDERDRDAVVLRCLQDRPFAEIGRTLRISEDAARKRVDRALEKLRGLLTARGITSTNAALAVVLTSQAALAAPAGLAARVSGLALCTTVGPTAGPHILAFMSSTKASLSIAVVIAAAASGLLYVQHSHEVQLQQEVIPVRQAVARPPAAPSSAQPTVGARVDGTIPSAGVAQTKSSLPIQAGAATDSPGPSLTGGMVRVSDWKNRGRATPLAAVESYLWAVDQVDVGVTGDAIGFGDWKSKVDEFYATLPEAIRAKYDTPEKLWALVLTATPHGPSITSFEVVSQNSDPAQPDKYVILHVRTENEQGVTTEGDMRFEPSPDGWRRTLPDNLIAPMYDYAKLLSRSQ